MMKHRPIEPDRSDWRRCLGRAFYIQILSIASSCSCYHTIWTPVVIDKPLRSLLPCFLAVLVFRAGDRPCDVCDQTMVSHRFAKLLTTLISRMNMVASGKFFLANTLHCKRASLFYMEPTVSPPLTNARRLLPLSTTTPFNTWLYYPVHLQPVPDRYRHAGMESSTPATAHRLAGPHGSNPPLERDLTLIIWGDGLKSLHNTSNSHRMFMILGLFGRIGRNSDLAALATARMPLARRSACLGRWAWFCMSVRLAVQSLRFPKGRNPKHCLAGEQQ